jgi:Fe-S-cluster containining protein
MKDLSKITLDARNKKLIFHGDCNEVRDVCEAICCRIYDVTVTEEERGTGRYDVREICSVTNAECENRGASCMNRRYFLKKKEDGSCAYLDDGSKCSIHPDRPQACRDFHCREGWQIAFAYAPDTEDYHKWRDEVSKEFMMETLKDDMIFTLNPSVRLKTLFYAKDKGEITFVRDMRDKCGLVPVKCDFSGFPAGDKELLHLVDLFDGKNTLKDVRGRFAADMGQELSREELYRLVWLLYCHKIIIFRNDTGVFRR